MFNISVYISFLLIAFEDYAANILRPLADSTYLQDTSVEVGVL